MNDEQIKDARLEMELENPAYDIVDDAISYTMKKYHYREYDLVKLVMIIYEDDYSFISNDNDYRDQFKLLDDYFRKQYGHNVITFVMMREIIKLKDTKSYDDITSEIAMVEKVLRTNDNLPPEDLCVFSYPVKNKKYDDLLYLIEKNISMKYALAMVYDKLKNSKK
ncbi:MAG: hypothetical protein IKJ43_03230 [Bacilli bacterium]|nr:hypothetical protein [Bacilli bacterium]